MLPDIPTDRPVACKVVAAQASCCGAAMARPALDSPEEIQQNQSAKWLRRNLDLIWRGQYGPRGFWGWRGV